MISVIVAGEQVIDVYNIYGLWVSGVNDVLFARS